LVAPVEHGTNAVVGNLTKCQQYAMILVRPAMTSVMLIVNPKPQIRFSFSIKGRKI
jgi:hypothetical protein